MNDVKTALEIAEENIKEDTLPLPEEPESKFDPEIDALVQDFNNPEYLKIENIMGMRGQPLVGIGQTFDIFSDELQKSIVFEAEKIRGLEMILRSTKIIPENFMNKGQKIVLFTKERHKKIMKDGKECNITLAGEYVEFEVKEVKRKGLTLYAKGIKNPNFKGESS